MGAAMRAQTGGLSPRPSYVGAWHLRAEGGKGALIDGQECPSYLGLWIVAFGRSDRTIDLSWPSQ